jgi:hypothetical protein
LEPEPKERNGYHVQDDLAVRIGPEGMLALQLSAQGKVIVNLSIHGQYVLFIDISQRLRTAVYTARLKPKIKRASESQY